MAKQDVSQILQTVLLAKGNGVQLGKETEKLIERFLAKNLKALDDEERAEARQREEAMKTVVEREALLKRIRARCPHRKEDGKSALFGQRLINGQECLVCLKCGSDFFDPPNKELKQVAAPPHLTANRQFIGSQLNR